MNSVYKEQKSLYPVPIRLLNLLDGYPIQTLVLILLLGVLLSTIVTINNPPSVRSGQTDSWWTIALNLVEGHGYSSCLPQYFPFCESSNQWTAAREPLPVLLFALGAWLGKESLWTAVLIETGLYLAVIPALYLLTREWANARAAIIASFVWTIYLPALELIPKVSGDLAATLFTTLGILFTLRGRKTQRASDWMIAGATLGMASLSRSAMLAVAIILIGGQLLEGVRERWQTRAIIKPVLLISSLVILIMLPWLIRNRLALGRPVIGSSLVSYNLYRHNYMITTNEYFRYVGPEEGAEAIGALIARRPDLTGRENEAEMDSIYREEALRIIKAHPGQYALLSAYRVFPLWFDWKVSEAYGSPTNRYGYAIMLLQAILLILASLGLRKNVRYTWPLWASILAVSFAYMAVIARLPYVIPVMPLVISLSAAGANRMLESIFKSRYKGSGNTLLNENA